MAGAAMKRLDELSVREVAGVGAQKAEELKELGIHTIEDLIEYFPYRYEDYRPKPIHLAKDGEKMTVLGEICGVPVLQRYGKNKSRLSCKMMADRFLITAVWFNQPYLKERLQPGIQLAVTGKWDLRRRQITVSSTDFSGARSSRLGTVQPVYPLAGRISQPYLRKIIHQALQSYGEWIPEILPEAIIAKYRLMSRRESIHMIHFPPDVSKGQAARRRLVYEELFLFQLKLQAYRAITRRKPDGIAHPIDTEAVREFIRNLPFELTASQKEAISEIIGDLRQPYAMNRLLQGDVGSGKTVVAAVALFAVAQAGSQGALMVPTEILAEQHAASLEKWFSPYGIQVALLTGSLTERKRRDVLAGLQSGLVDIVVGTHALIQEDVFFRHLGLVITDEQHRFGVNQRSVLRRKGLNADVLAMTATPIPRTLAITAFGDMDVSTLREMPAGRKPVRTYWVKPDMLERVFRFVQKEIAMGRQAYIICPLIEESDKLDVQNALDVHARLQQMMPQNRIGLLHGRMTPKEKEDVMRAFASNQVQALVSTTVVEVGVDVPNASVIVVYDADRFGLSQLHQLRGRVGRGEHESYCILVADPKTEVGRERLAVMTKTRDGFEIARKDLELRGPGDVFGTKQSGLPEFRLADLATDFAVLEAARNDAAELVARDEFWTSLEYLPLRRILQKDQIFDGLILD